MTANGEFIKGIVLYGKYLSNCSYNCLSSFDLIFRLVFVEKCWYDIIYLSTSQRSSLYLYQVEFSFTGMTDRSGIRFHFTPSIRQFDSGLLEVGHVISPYHIIPPRQRSFKSYGYCMKECLVEVTNLFILIQPIIWSKVRPFLLDSNVVDFWLVWEAIFGW